MPKNTRLIGHELRLGGVPFKADGSRKTGSGNVGHAKCACGDLSPELPSTNQRKNWHRAHKEAIIALTTHVPAVEDQ